MRIELVPRITAGYMQIDAVHKTPHTGVDVALPIGSNVYAPEPGIVSRIADYGDISLGKAVFMRTKTGHQIIFGHLSDVKVQLGERIHSGELLALSGNSGNSTGPHLHVGVVNSAGTFMDPSRIIDGIVERKLESLRDAAAHKAYDIVIGVLEGLRDLVVDLSYSIALIGGGLAIIMHVAGYEKGGRIAGMLTVGYVLIKYLLG